MPIYLYKCNNCEAEEEIIKKVEDRGYQSCSSCGRMMVRDFSKQTFSVSPDIEPGYNFSLGENITSRKHLRERMAYHNTYSPDISGGDPSDGVLTKEERAIEEGRMTSSGRTILDRRDEVEQSFDLETDITVDGQADYNAIRKDIREVHDEGRRA